MVPLVLEVDRYLESAKGWGISQPIREWRWVKGTRELGWVYVVVYELVGEWEFLDVWKGSR